MNYQVECRNKNCESEINKNLFDKPQKIKWIKDGIDYELLSTEQNYIRDVYLQDDYLIVLYFGDSINFPHPQNLVVYNLNKEIIKIINTPKLKSIEARRFTGKEERRFIEAITGYVVDYEDKKYIKIAVGPNVPVEHYFEFQLLNLKTFEFHPSYSEPLYYR
jgi:hypothetical protein